MFNFSLTSIINNLVNDGANQRLTDKGFIEHELTHFLKSKSRKAMLTGERYYRGHHDILSKSRTAIGEGGKKISVENLPNNKIVDNQYRKMVNQKKNYLLGQPITLNCDNDSYTGYLKRLFNMRFLRLLKNVGEDALNGGIAWVYIHYDRKGELSFKRFSPYEVKPFWTDAEHTRLEGAIRMYEIIGYNGLKEESIQKVEVYSEGGIDYFERSGTSLVPCKPYHSAYFDVLNEDGSKEQLNWSKIPLVAFKYNAKEIPLINMVKSLQDGLNKIESNWEDNMEEDARNTIMVVVNYDGEDLGEFRRNLATYGAVKVRSTDGANGDVKTLQVTVNSENYKAIIEIFKKAIIENAMGYDAKDDRMSGNPNQMNIQSMYSDIDLDANDMEAEFQASFEDLMWFINCHLVNTGCGDFSNEDIKIIFNRDMLINESEIISDCRNSVGLISNKTIVANHPYVEDVEAELKQIEKERQKEVEQYGSAFPVKTKVGEDNEE